MLISHNWLQSFFKEKLPKPSELVKILTLHSFETEIAKQTVNNKQQTILEVDVLPNRAHDCLSHIGISREIAAITNSKFKIQNSKVIQNSKFKIQNFLNVEVRDKEFCPRYVARVIGGVKVGPSPRWMRERLEAIGQKPINNIVDATNYVMFEMGQPVHAFDLDKISGIQNQISKIYHSPTRHPLRKIYSKYQKSNIKNIIVRKAMKREKITTLEGEKYDLDKDILVIADSQEPIAIAGIKGGEKAEITNETKNIILEAANFDPTNIRKTSGKLGLRTESSIRFEHGLDPNLATIAMERVAVLIQEIAEGKIVNGAVDIYSKKIYPQKIRLDFDYVERLLGAKISEKEIKNILKRLGFQCNEARPRYIMVEVPTLRLDINIPEDLIEEIARIYGYENIKLEMPLAALIPAKRNDAAYWQEFARDILKGLGFSEIYNYSFIGEGQAMVFSCSHEKLIEIENPASIDQKYLRPSLIPNLLRNIEKNLNNSPVLKIFEIGKIFENQKLMERRTLSGLIVKKEAKLKKEGFYELKGVLDSLMEQLGISDVSYGDYQTAPEEQKTCWRHPQKCAEIKIGGKRIGFIGVISPWTIEEFGIGEVEAVYFDIYFDEFSEYVSEEHEYRPISKYPEVLRDIAVLVPLDARVEDVLQKIDSVGGKLIRDIDLFDMYEGEGLPEGRKNLAFHIMFQAEDHTLTSKEVDEIMGKIIYILEQNSEWEVRK